MGVGPVVVAGGAIGVDEVRVGDFGRREPPGVSRAVIFLNAVFVAGV